MVRAEVTMSAGDRQEERTIFQRYLHAARALPTTDLERVVLRDIAWLESADPPGPGNILGPDPDDPLARVSWRSFLSRAEPGIGTIAFSDDQTRATASFGWNDAGYTVVLEKVGGEWQLLRLANSITMY
jgi:hypothetical protein